MQADSLLAFAGYLADGIKDEIKSLTAEVHTDSKETRNQLGSLSAKLSALEVELRILGNHAKKVSTARTEGFPAYHTCHWLMAQVDDRKACR